MTEWNKLIKGLLFPVILTLVLCCGGIAAAADSNVLKFNASGEFKMMQITDTHIERGDDNDKRTIRLLEKMLDAEKPDLVVFTGDNIAITQDYKATIDRLIQPLIERRIKWAAVLGNHDDETKVNGQLTTFSRKDIMQYLCDKPYSLSQMGPADIHGYGNYVLKINSDKSATQWVLYLFDSNAYPDHKEDGKYGWIRLSQVMWYDTTSKQLAREAEASGKTVKAMAFFHIPLPEYTAAFDLGNVVWGHKFEKVCSPDMNSGLFTAMLERGDVKAVFVGHDHVNDYEAEYHGVKLCYGRASGYNAYGDDKLPRGSKIITLNEKTAGFTIRTVEAEKD